MLTSSGGEDERPQIPAKTPKQAAGLCWQRVAGGMAVPWAGTALPVPPISTHMEAFKWRSCSVPSLLTLLLA